ncbi:hypothetical protein C8J57DRAFT_1236134 [Mycena rebaudengoi]|nr:hypothetical protein C8J57DRAFT_1236134 [Mycena rebaudengoi]
MSHNGTPPLDDTLGAIEIGGIVGTFLFGIVTLQTFVQSPKLQTIAWTYHLNLARSTEVDECIDKFIRSNGLPQLFRTRRMVDTLILWTIESGLATGGCSVIMMILFVLRNDLTWGSILPNPSQSIFQLVPSLLRLNGRQRIRAMKRNTVHVNTGPRSSTTSPSLFVAPPDTDGEEAQH